MEVNQSCLLSEATVLLCVLRNNSHLFPAPSSHIRGTQTPAASSVRPPCRAGRTGHETPGPASTGTLRHDCMDTHGTEYYVVFV